jgi:hypothetical protein
MLKIIGPGMGAREVGPYRVEDARPTGGVVAATAGVAAGTTTGAVAGILGMDAHPVRRYRVEDARPIDGEDEAGGETVRWARAASDQHPDTPDTLRGLRMAAPRVARKASEGWWGR